MRPILTPVISGVGGTERLVGVPHNAARAHRVLSGRVGEGVSRLAAGCRLVPLPNLSRDASPIGGRRYRICLKAAFSKDWRAYPRTMLALMLLVLFVVVPLALGYAIPGRTVARMVWLGLGAVMSYSQAQDDDLGAAWVLVALVVLLGLLFVELGHWLRGRNARS